MTPSTFASAAATPSFGSCAPLRIREIDDLLSISDVVFAAEALVALANAADRSSRTALFYRFWTLGEAFIKATGQGLGQGTKTFAFNTNDTPRLLRVNTEWGPAERWCFGVTSEAD